MSQQRFDRLRERLLRAGIAPRHVRRYLGELGDHFEDLVREQTSQGVLRATAETAAHTRLGSDEALAEVMLARPELRSLASRYPWAVFGIGPVAMLALTIAMVIFIEFGLLPLILQAIFEKTNFVSAEFRAWGQFLYDVANWALVFVAPLVIAAFLCRIGIEQRMPTFWILLGLVVICVVGGSHYVGIEWSLTRDHPSRLDIGLGLAPPLRPATILACVMRIAVNLALAGSFYWLWRKRQESTEP